MHDVIINLLKKLATLLLVSAIAIILWSKWNGYQEFIRVRENCEVCKFQKGKRKQLTFYLYNHYT